MKTKLINSLAFLLLLTSGLFAQNKLAVGIIGTRFGNTASDSKLTEIKNPMGYGVVASYALSNEFGIAFTGEYFKDDMENNLGQEKDLRLHVSAFLRILQSATVSPYISAGVVYTNRNINYSKDNSDKNIGIADARFGAGIDYNLIQNLSLNFDLGIYNNGLNVVGWSSSLGLRYGVKL
jgi:hypothetical protein